MVCLVMACVLVVRVASYVIYSVFNLNVVLWI
jgi:hypothetical protein